MDPLRPLRPGDPLKSGLSASRLNRLMEIARTTAALRPNVGGSASRFLAPHLGPIMDGLIEVPSLDEPFLLPLGAPVSLSSDEPATGTTAMGEPLAAEHGHVTRFKPAVAGERWWITIGPRRQAGEIVRVRVGGFALARVASETRPSGWVDVGEDGDDHLVVVDFGPGRILLADAEPYETDRWYCIVELGGAYSDELVEVDVITNVCPTDPAIADGSITAVKIADGAAFKNGDILRGETF